MGNKAILKQIRLLVGIPKAKQQLISALDGAHIVFAGVSKGIRSCKIIGKMVRLGGTYHYILGVGPTFIIKNNYFGHPLLSGGIIDRQQGAIAGIWNNSRSNKPLFHIVITHGSFVIRVYG